MLCLWVRMCTVCVPGVLRGQKRASPTLGLELQMVVSHHYKDAGNASRSTATTTSAPNHWAHHPAPTSNLLKETSHINSYLYHNQLSMASSMFITFIPSRAHTHTHINITMYEKISTLVMCSNLIISTGVLWTLRSWAIPGKKQWVCCYLQSYLTKNMGFKENSNNLIAGDHF